MNFLRSPAQLRTRVSITKLPYYSPTAFRRRVRVRMPAGTTMSDDALDDLSTQELHDRAVRRA